MSRQHRLLLLMSVIILAVALAIWPSRWSAPAYANVTLVSFAASPVPGKPDIDIEWETATEFDTVGFFVTRSNSAGGTYARVSGFIPHTGDTVVGAPYGWTDRNLVSNRSYWYELEEITQSQDSNFFGPISVTLTFTPTLTATPTTRPATKVVKPTASPSRVEATPHRATGSTITPRPTAAGSSANPAVSAASPTLESSVKNSQPSVAIATSMPAASDASTPTSTPPPVIVEAAQVAGPALSPTDAVPGAAVPVIVVTESASAAAATDTVSGPALLLIAAAFLFLGIAFVILRQARR